MTEARFRLVLVLYLVLTVAMCVASYFGPESFSPALAAAYENEPQHPIFDDVWMALALFVPLVVAMLAGLLGLFLFKRWGRTLSLYSTLASFLLLPFFGPTVASSIEASLYEASTLLWGAVLALAYFSPVSGRFAAGRAT